jgi:hypothetical protein
MFEMIEAQTIRENDLEGIQIARKQEPKMCVLLSDTFINKFDFFGTLKNGCICPIL